MFLITSVREQCTYLFQTINTFRTWSQFFCDLLGNLWHNKAERKQLNMEHPNYLDKRDFTGEDKSSPSTMPMDVAYDSLAEIATKFSKLASTTHDPRYLQEYIKTGVLMAQSQASPHDFAVMIRACREMYRANCVFASYRHIRKISIFGSARIKQDEPAYHTTLEFARKCNEHGYMVITGGGPGIMQAANEGAGVERSFGLNITLPFEQHSNHVVANSERLINFYYFFVRKLNFVAECDAMVALPGGFGTMDEVFETLTLIQTGKATIYPLVLLDSPGKTFWLNWMAFIRVELLDSGLISEDDLHLIFVTKSPEEAINHIDQFYRIFHSYRFIDDKIVIRMNTNIPTPWLKMIENEFSDLIVEGGHMTLGGPLPEEEDEPHLAQLPRLIFPIKRGNYGRLRLLIDRINETPNRSYKPE